MKITSPRKPSASLFPRCALGSAPPRCLARSCRAWGGCRSMPLVANEPGSACRFRLQRKRGASVAASRESALSPLLPHAGQCSQRGSQTAKYYPPSPRGPAEAVRSISAAPGLPPLPPPIFSSPHPCSATNRAIQTGDWTCPCLPIYADYRGSFPLRCLPTALMSNSRV